MPRIGPYTCVRLRGRLRSVLLASLLSAVSAPGLFGQASVTRPVEEFGFELGADYHLASYAQLERYWVKLADESDRMSLETIGESAEGRPIYMAVITSPENQRNLGRYREISRRLALARGVDEDEARALAAEGRAVVWIDGGLHATETLGAQQLMEMVYRMVSRSDAETLRLLDETILLAVCPNPDGLDLVADWYMREPVPSARSLDGLPRLYQKYAGHDNNRDFFMSSQPETQAINRVLYREWFPQIVYNHHQTAPEGTVLFAPPFRDPFNYNIDPLVLTSLDLVAGAMHSRFLAEGKPGATMRSGADYSTWWNGGLRTSPYFHNMIGLLTETIGGPNPMRIPAIPGMQVPRGDYPAPVEPGVWHFSQSVEYSISANRAVLDFAARYRDQLLYNAWRMGTNSIERGSRDHWTLSPADLERVEEAADSVDRETVVRLLRSPQSRDPRGFVIPSDQPDFLTATRFVNALILNGVEVRVATEDFQLGRAAYPAGSYVVRADQAFRPQVMDMFEPQDHPDDFAFPGAAPTAPYDTAGWTLAYQMGVRFDRILEGFDGPFELVPDVRSMPAGRIQGGGDVSGYFLSHQTNDAFVAINRLLEAGDRVFWLREAAGNHPEGTIYIRRGSGTPGRLNALARSHGLVFEGTRSEPAVDALELRPVRIGLWDEYGGSESSGWTRFVLESFGFGFDRVYAPRLDAGNLRASFDVLVFPNGAITERASRRRAPAGEAGETYRDQIGSVTREATVPRLREFLERGGAVLSVGGSTVLAGHLDLPVENGLTESGRGDNRPLDAEEFFVPGSILRAEVDTGHPLAYGLEPEVDVFFDQSPAFHLTDRSRSEGYRAVAWYPDEPLRSGWAWGEEFLEGAAAIVDAPVGDGRLILYGPEVTFRAQSHGTFRFLFNGIYYPSAVPVTLGGN